MRRIQWQSCECKISRFHSHSCEGRKKDDNHPSSKIGCTVAMENRGRGTSSANDKFLHFIILIENVFLPAILIFFFKFFKIIPKERIPNGWSYHITVCFKL